ncbi:hypothetical protein fugu_011379 [Takifugu bimaculatus]|uniref:Uncharacterized protein n=1 Tax=Takifugu bimaculatus TaxID=433685 RepID=A0A4Z2C7D6_9TELE|nr:hypothetical protein fugu_011379 [Takifugu bimaculatus]
MSGYGRHRHGPPSPRSRPIRQKLQFASSDGEDDLIDDVHNSTGGESGFTEIDSPVPARRSPAGKRLEGSSSPLNQSGGDDDVELWDEESLGSPAHLQSPSSVSFSNCSPSPRKASRLYRGSPERPYTQDEGEGSSSPVPDCPDTPPHKTFRKLRLLTRRTHQRASCPGPEAAPARPAGELPSSRMWRLRGSRPKTAADDSRPPRSTLTPSHPTPSSSSPSRSKGSTGNDRTGTSKFVRGLAVLTVSHVTCRTFAEPLLMESVSLEPLMVVLAENQDLVVPGDLLPWARGAPCWLECKPHLCSRTFQLLW